MSGLAATETARGWRYAAGRAGIEIGRNGSPAGWTWDGRDLLYVSPRSLPDRRLRGGMPVCWPWFGAAPVAGLPPHGFLLDDTLDLAPPRANGDSVTVTLAGTIADRPGFAGTARVTVSHVVSTTRPRLATTVTVDNPGAAPIGFGIGFHPYLALPRPARRLVVVADGRSRDVPAVIDDKLACPAGGIDLRDGDMALWRIVSAATSTLGLWRIDAAKSAAIADLPDDADSRFVCVNPIAFGETLAPGERGAYAITLEPQPALFA
jgi:glucose-6-phosphate 1-epimerase